MAQRQFLYQYDSAAVQGEGSYVKLRALKWGDSKKLAARRDAMSQEEQVLLHEEMIREHVVEWNWVDYDGNPLPLPKENPQILDDMTNEEMTFLSECLGGVAARKKS